MMTNTTAEDPAATISQEASSDTINHQFAIAILPVTIIIGIVGVVGFIGNILIIIVYSKHYARINFRYFVLFLAFTDLTSCSIIIPIEVYTQLNWYKSKYRWLCKVRVYFNLLTSWNSASILLLFAFDRFRKICFPMKWQIRPSLARKLSACLAMTSMIAAGPLVFAYANETYEFPTEHGPVNVTACARSDEIQEPLYGIFLYSYISIMSLMMVLTTSLNAMTAIKLLCGKRLLRSTNRTELSNMRRQEDTDRYDRPATTPSSSTVRSGNPFRGGSGTVRCSNHLIIMFVLAIVFVVTVVLYMVITPSVMIRLTGMPLSNSEKVMFFTLWRLYFINYVLNPFLYGYLDKRFRTGLTSLFCGL